MLIRLAISAVVTAFLVRCHAQAHPSDDYCRDDRVLVWVLAHRGPGRPHRHDHRLTRENVTHRRIGQRLGGGGAGRGSPIQADASHRSQRVQSDCNLGLRRLPTEGGSLPKGWHYSAAMASWASMMR
jgi:hypothetical protein